MKIENGIVIDENNNRADIGYWGTEEAAIAALKTCFGCSDCFGCSACSRCSRCAGCFECSAQKTEMAIPVIDDIHKRVFEAASQPNALCMSSWNKCGTTHCRGGWVVTLAGKEGRELEEKTSTLFAAIQIYKASGYVIYPIRFFDSEEKSLEDMKRLAEESSTTKKA